MKKNRQSLAQILAKNENNEPKNHAVYHIAENAFVDQGEGLLEFPNGLTITDDGDQYNGTRYDIPSIDISEYKNNLTANHSDQIQEIIGKTFGIRKRVNRVTIDKIQFAVKENALARYAYNMIKGGYISDFSTETVGPWPDNENIYRNAKIVGLSLVVSGNNPRAMINDRKASEIAVKSINEAKKDGLDTSYIEKNLVCYNNDKDDHIKNSKDKKIMYVTIKNDRDFAVKITYKNAAGDEVSRELAPGDSVDVSENQKEALESQIKNAKKPEEKIDFKSEINSAVNEALKPVVEKMEAIEKKAFNQGATEPTFQKNDKKGQGAAPITNQLEGMDYLERHGKQIEYAWNWLKGGSPDAYKKLMEINKFHLEKLQEEKMVRNTITIEDMGSFVISRELLTDIEGHRSNYTDLLNAVTFRDTLSTQMAWLKRSGDVDMQEVEMCDDDADGNLKPIKEYSASIKTSDLHEVAAVTPVCNAATRFLAVDLLGDVAAGYRMDYDRKRAQLLIARLQQAVNETGYKIPYNGTTDTTTLQSWVDVVSKLSEEVPNGKYVFSFKTKWAMIRRLIGAGISGPLAVTLSSGDLSPILGKNYIVVPNDLLPTLDTAETKSFTVDGVSVSIDQSVFYFDPMQFSGRTSGGLQYDLSTEAAYEDSEGNVKSAYQRNELVLRGSFFRGGAIRDTAMVTSMYAAGVS